MLDYLRGLTAERLKDILQYDRDSGVFTWLIAMKGTHKGSVAGSTNRVTGYLSVCIGDSRYYQHRLAWLYEHGGWPDGQIDHINGDKSDNRINNLRDVTSSENQQNKRAAASNSASGYLGVIFNKQCGKWQARITVVGKQYHIGLFDDPKDAYEAYVLAKRERHPNCTI